MDVCPPLADVDPSLHKPRRTYAELQQRARMKAEKELREAERLLRDGRVSDVAISTMALALLVGYSTKSIESWRKGEHWSNQCARGYSGATNQPVKYGLQCVHDQIKRLASPPPPTSNPFGVTTQHFAGFATFESATLVDEPWVFNRRGQVIGHAVVVPDEVLDEALDGDCVRERTLADLLLHEPWESLSTREYYRQVLTYAFDNANTRAFAAAEEHVLRDTLGPGPARTIPKRL